MMGVEGRQLEATKDGRLIPVTAPLGVKVVSIWLILPADDTPVIWRGPIKTSFIREVLAYTDWGELDYLLVDLPPGTGDEQLTIMQLVKGLTGVIIVTIPSEVSRSVVVKAISFARKLNARIIGLIENMSYFECPDGTRHYIFGRGVGERIAREYGIRLLGSIPPGMVASRLAERLRGCRSVDLAYWPAKRLVERHMADLEEIRRGVEEALGVPVELKPKCSGCSAECIAVLAVMPGRLAEKVRRTMPGKLKVDAVLPLIAGDLKEYVARLAAEALKAATP
jgi:hypothetical protein